jgi:undecaprenyl-diphosphatase
MIKAILNTDLLALHFLNSFAGNWAIDHIIFLISSSNLFKGVLLISFYWYYWFKDPSWTDDTIRSTLLKGILAGFVAIFIARALANALPIRIRPVLDPGAGFSIDPTLLESLKKNLLDWSSFPSDHAAFAIALSASICWISRIVGLYLVAYSLLFICLPRVYLGVHWPSDILIGAILGAMSAATIQMSQWFDKAVNYVISFSERRRQVFYAVAFAFSAELGQMFDNVILFRKAASMLLQRYLHLSAGSMIAIVSATVAFIILVTFTAYRAIGRSES